MIDNPHVKVTVEREAQNGNVFCETSQEETVPNVLFQFCVMLSTLNSTGAEHDIQ